MVERTLEEDPWHKDVHAAMLHKTTKIQGGLGGPWGHQRGSKWVLLGWQVKRTYEGEQAEFSWIDQSGDALD